MRNQTQLVLAAFTATLVLGVAVGSVQARRFELSNVGLRIAWSSLTFGDSSSGNGNEFICPATLEGTFHSRTFSKVSGVLIGYITNATLTSSKCSFHGIFSHVKILNGTEGTVNTLPWHVNYLEFKGILPNIADVDLILPKFAFLVTAAGGECLYEATSRRPFGGDLSLRASGAVTELTSQPEREILRREGSFLCPSIGVLRGQARVTVLGTETGISIRLVA